MNNAINHLNALELAALRYFATASFETDHSAPAHPGMLADLRRRGLLESCLGSYNTTEKGEAALVASPLTIKIDGGEVSLRSEGKIERLRRYCFVVTLSRANGQVVEFPYVRTADPIAHTGELTSIVEFCRNALKQTDKFAA